MFLFIRRYPKSIINTLSITLTQNALSLALNPFIAELNLLFPSWKITPKFSLLTQLREDAIIPNFWKLVGQTWKNGCPPSRKLKKIPNRKILQPSFILPAQPETRRA